MSEKRIEKLLEAWPSNSLELLEDIERFVHLRNKFKSTYELHLSLFLMPVEMREIEAVLQAGDMHAAATELLKFKLDRWP